MSGWLNPPGDLIFRMNDVPLTAFLKTTGEQAPGVTDFRCGKCEEVLHSPHAGFRHLLMAHPELLPPSLSSDATPGETKP